jgi:hypothetical protein
MEMYEILDRTLENSLWKRLWTSLKREYVMMMIMVMMKMMTTMTTTTTTTTN